MDMTNTVRELTEGYDKMKNLLKRKLIEEAFDMNDMDADMMEFMFGILNMSDLSMKLVKQQAETIQDINGKLDKLLEQRDKG